MRNDYLSIADNQIMALIFLSVIRVKFYLCNSVALDTCQKLLLIFVKGVEWLRLSGMEL